MGRKGKKKPNPNVVVGSNTPSLGDRLKSHKVVILIIVVLFVTVGGGAYWYFAIRDQGAPESFTNGSALNEQDLLRLEALSTDEPVNNGEGASQQTQTEASRQASEELIANAKTDEEKLNYLSDLADHCYWIKDYACAADAYERALALEPNNLTLLLQAARSFNAINDPKKATSFLQRAEDVAANIQDESIKENVQYDISNLRQELGI